MDIVRNLFICFLLVCFSSIAFAGTPTFSLSFSPTTIGPGGVSTMTYTIDNSAQSTGVSGLTFSNTLPAGMTVSSPNNDLNTCSNGYYTAAAGSNSIAFNDYRLGAGSSCTFSLDVTSSTVGTHTNTTGSLSTSAGDAGTASAALTVDNGGLQVAMTFSKSPVEPSEITTLTYTFDATSLALNIISISATQTLNGITVSEAPNIGGTCNFGITAIANSSNIQFTSGSLAVGATCTVTVDVSGVNAGTYTNTLAQVYYTLSNYSFNTSNATQATVIIQKPLMYASFPASASPGSAVSLTYHIANFERSDITNLNFTNDLNATLSGLAATALPANGFCGSGSTVSGSSNLSFSGINLTSASDCSFTITVLIPANAAVGSYTNNTSVINLERGGNATTESVISNALLIQAAPTLTMSVLDSVVSAGNDVTFRYVLTNTDSGNPVSNIAFSQSINDVVSGTTVKTLPNANSCGTGSTFTTSFSSDIYTFNVADGLIAAGDSCTFDLVVTLSAGAAIGAYTYSTTSVSATVNSSSVYGAKATANIEVLGAPSLAFGIVENSAIPDSSITANFTFNYSNNASADATGVGFTVDLNAALSGMASSSGIQTDICGSGSSISGTSTLTFSGGSLSPNGSCTFAVNLTIPAGAAPGLVTTTSSQVTATSSGISVKSGEAGDEFIITGLSLSKQFLPSTVLPNGTGIIRYTINNAATALSATALQFTDNLNLALSGLKATSTLSVPCYGSSGMTGSTSVTLSGGELQPGESCTFDLPISIPASAGDGVYTSVTGNMSATVNNVNTETPAASATLVVEQLSVLLSTTSSSPTSSATIPVKIDFSRSVTGLNSSDFTVTNGTVNNLGGSGQAYTVDITPTTDGVVTITLPVNTVNDAVDGAVQNPASNTISVTYESAPVVPNVTLGISSPSNTLTNVGPVTYTATYTGADEINLVNSSIILNKTGTANASVVVTNGTTSTPTITLSNITGDGVLGISVVDGSARNSLYSAAAVGPSSGFTIDNTLPTVSITDVVAPNINSPFSATFTFSENVTGFALSDINVGNGTASNLAVISATVYTADITPAADGVVTVDVAAGVATDTTGNGNSVAVKHSVNYDATKPTVNITNNLSNSSYANAPFTATMTFSEDVTGFIVSDITPSNANLSSFVSVSAKVYTVVVTPISEGAVTLNIVQGVAQDSVTNTNTAAIALSVEYDITNPTVLISGVAGPINGGVTTTLTFSEAVTGFAISDIDVGNGAASNLVAVSSSVYKADIAPTADGSVTVDVSANVAADNAGNNNSAASQYSVTYDSAEPTLLITGDSGPVNNIFLATFTFNEAVTGFALSDIVVSNGAASNFVSTSTTVYTADITSSADGTVTVNVAASSAQDSAGNGNVAAAEFSLEYDATQPTVALTANTVLTNAAFTATMTFSEDVSDFIVSDITPSNASLSSFVSVSAKVYTVVVTPISEGAVTLNIAQGLAQDSATNTNTAAGELSVEYDITNPTVLISGVAGPINGNVTTTFTFSEAVTGFTISDITVGNGTASNFVTVSSSVYKADITPTSDGSVIVDVAGSVVTDYAGNNNTAASPYSVIYDSTKPQLQLSVEKTLVNDVFVVTFQFLEEMTGFSIDDITLKNANKSNFISTNPSKYQVTITPIIDGQVFIDVYSDVAIDDANNGNAQGNQLVVEFDKTRPTIEIKNPDSDLKSEYVASIGMSEIVTGFDVSDIEVINGDVIIFHAVTKTSFSALVKPKEIGEQVIMRVPDNACSDLAGNLCTESNEIVLTFDGTPPEVVLSVVQSAFTDEFEVDIKFSELIQDMSQNALSIVGSEIISFSKISDMIYRANLKSTGSVLFSTVKINQGVVFDEAGNGNSASNELMISFDQDGDGIINSLDKDSDNDGISDENEIKYGLDPLNPLDGAFDSDGDGYSNAEEILRGSDPFNKNDLPSNEAINSIISILLNSQKN